MKRIALVLFLAAVLCACSATAGGTPTASPTVLPTASEQPVLETEPATEPPEVEITVAPEIPDTTSPDAVEPSPSQTPDSTADPAEPEMYVVTASLLFFRSEPIIKNDTVLALIPKGMKVRKMEDAVSPFVHVEAPDGRDGFVSSQYLTRVTGSDFPKGIAYTHVDPASQKTKDELGNDIVLTSNLVDVRKVIPGIQVYMIFSTDKNFTGKVQYPRDFCLLQKAVAAKLKKAQGLFQKDGYGIKVYDAYRPYSVQKILYNIVKDGRYIANPATGGSMHNRGGAVDMTLVDKDGLELEMPTPMHTLNATANRDYKGMSAKARKNMDYMTKIMRSSGFVPISTEWWHFQISSAEGDKYMLSDYDFTKIYPIYEYVKE